MSQRFLQVEGVNLSNLFDTQQISAIRGGSMLLKQCVNGIANAFRAELRTLSSGASMGLFEVMSVPGPSTEPIEKRVVDWLAACPDYRVLTILVAVCEASSFAEAQARLRSKIRILQTRSPNIAPDPPPTGGFAAEPCGFEGRRARPAQPTWPDRWLDGMRRATCESFDRRLRWGREQRERKLYVDELNRRESSAMWWPDCITLISLGTCINSRVMRPMPDYKTRSRSSMWTATALARFKTLLSRPRRRFGCRCRHRVGGAARLR